MKIRDIMTREPEVIRPDASIQEAAQIMKQLNVGSLPVCNGGKVLGMITDRDITTRATAERRDSNSTPVKEIMSAEVYYCFDDQDVREAAEVMSQYQIRRLPIVDRDKNLVGIVSLGDLSVDAGSDKLSGDTLEDISNPSKPER
jgi:CBS domain-containing protein